MPCPSSSSNLAALKKHLLKQTRVWTIRSFSKCCKEQQPGKKKKRARGKKPLLLLSLLLLPLLSGGRPVPAACPGRAPPAPTCFHSSPGAERCSRARWPGKGSGRRAPHRGGGGGPPWNLTGGPQTPALTPITVSQAWDGGVCGV